MSLAKIAYTMQFAITFTLNPKVFKHDVIKQHELFMEQINKICEMCNWKVSIVLELTNSFNCHYHGFISIPMTNTKRSVPHNIVNMLRTNTVIGYICVKTLDNDFVWKEYTLKNLTKTFDETGINPICRDDHNKYTDNFMDCYSDA